MFRWSAPAFVALAMFPVASLAAQDATVSVGSLRGLVLDGDFHVPLPNVEVSIVENGRKTTTGSQGNWSMPDLAPGRYTVVFSKEGYVRVVRADVLVQAGRLTDVDVRLGGEFTDLEEFVVQDLLGMGGGTEAALLALRFESPALLDSIGSELMSRAGASDAAAALRLVAGASVQDGKFAVVRGLPDRYVSSQLNGVRLPSADEDKRAVELDQFPAAAIESIQVSKTFTPDQQGDASGGAVNVVLKSIPAQATLVVSGQLSYNSNAGGRDDFLSYEGGGLNFWGKDRTRGIQFENIGQNWDGAVGVSETEAPQDSKWAISGGGKLQMSDDWRIGAFGSVFYERDSFFHEGGRSDSLWVLGPGQAPTPEQSQVQGVDDFKTSLFDITRASQSVQWGTLGLLGVESDAHKLGLTYLYTRSAEDTAILAEDTRGKQFFYPGYDPTDENSPGYFDFQAAPYLRTETLEYTERTTSSVQLSGSHELGLEPGAFRVSPGIGTPRFTQPRFDWVLSRSTAKLYQPDKRQFGGAWTPGFDLGFFVVPSVWTPYKPAANFNLGNLQRIYKEIDEESRQVSANLTFPFERENGGKGYAKAGVFRDTVDRTFDQDTFSNLGDQSDFVGEFEDFWSAAFPSENHPIFPSTFDVDYRGRQRITAWYGMLDIPIVPKWSVIGGARVESTAVEVVNIPEQDATWFPPGSVAPVLLNPGDADVDRSQTDLLPSIGVAWNPDEQWTVRAGYSETIARQTFKELTPILQQEFLGGPIFIGNPELGTAAVRNWDLRVDWRPRESSLVSASVFHKDIRDVIEYVQVEGAQITYTTPRNYPEGRLTGAEIEFREHVGAHVRALRGLNVGANATLIDSRVTLPDDEVEVFETLGQPGLEKRDMTNAPEYLLNFNITYDIEETGTQFGVFYNVIGDTLVAGAGETKNRFVPSIYARSYGTLNLSASQRLGKYLRLSVQAKNVLDPDIKEVYRHDGEDYLHSTYSRGIDYSIALTARFDF
jgi:TonB-dependent receptor